MKSLGLLVLRLVFGGLMTIHGYPKIFGGQGQSEAISPPVKRVLGEGFTQQVEKGGLDSFTGMVENLAVPAPAVTARLGAGTEFFGGLALVLGWNTRLASLLLMGQMATAIRKVHWRQGLMGQGGAENAFLFFAAFLTLFIAGPGKLSVDLG